MNAHVEIEVPAALAAWGFDKQTIQNHVLEWMVLSLFTDNHISSGKAASLLNITRVEFLALLSKKGIAYINFNETELEEEFEAVNTLRAQIK